jgi:hypothetical protein
MKSILNLAGLLIIIYWTWSCKPQAKEWSGDALEIYNARQVSNDALKAHNLDKELSLMTDSVQITTGNGTLIRGKDNLRIYITTVPEQKMYWVRTPDYIEINDEQGLAWENGTWKGFHADKGPEPIAGGKYAAQWTRKDGMWKINSELFVKLN